MVLGNEELPALSVLKQLLVVIYYSGPQFLADHLQSPVCILSLITLIGLVASFF